MAKDKQKCKFRLANWMMQQRVREEYTWHNIVKALLHYAIFLATWLAILLRHKLHKSLPTVTCSEMQFLLLS